MTPRESYIHRLFKWVNSRHEVPATADPSAPQQFKAWKAAELGQCHNEQLEACKNTLSNWHMKTYASMFKHCIFGPQTLMSDKMLTKLATSADIKAVDIIKAQIPDWIWADEYGKIIVL